MILRSYWPLQDSSAYRCYTRSGLVSWLCGPDGMPTGHFNIPLVSCDIHLPVPCFLWYPPWIPIQNCAYRPIEPIRPSRFDGLKEYIRVKSPQLILNCVPLIPWFNAILQKKSSYLGQSWQNYITYLGPIVDFGSPVFYGFNTKSRSPLICFYSLMGFYFSPWPMITVS